MEQKFKMFYNQLHELADKQGKNAPSGVTNEIVNKDLTIRLSKDMRDWAERELDGEEVDDFVNRIEDWLENDLGAELE